MLVLQSQSKAAQQFPEQFNIAVKWIQLYSDNKQVRIIAIEGLDGTGKSKLVATLSKRLHASVEYSLHPALRPHRALYDTMGEYEMRQFYLLGNIALMAEIQTAEHSSPICILDRSYATTLSYYYGARARTEAEVQLPSAPIRWPPYLQPDVYIVLHCDEEERSRRIQHRSGEITVEENHLAGSDAMRRAIDYCYRNLEGSHLIDTTHLSPEQVANAALQTINLDHL